MSHDDAGVYRCGDPACSVCWLYGWQTAEWATRVREEWEAAAPFVQGGRSL